MNIQQRLELRESARACLRRAVGQQGVLRLPVELANQPGPVHPCNAATLFELHWRVDSAGRLRLKASIDGVIFEEVFT